MAADKLAPNILSDIAAQIAERLPASMELAAPGAAPGLGESLKIVMLPLDAVKSGEGPLAQRIIETGQWHHQIYAGRKAVNFARSIAPPGAPNGRHEVVEVATSTLPEALKKSIQWVDANMPDATDAEVLVAPAYFLTGLWIRGETGDSVVISSMADGLDGLDLNQRIDSGEFLSRLANNEPVQGLGQLPKLHGDESEIGEPA
ncbi:MAG TPA: hypothetical protein VK485_11410 [Sphingomicrobium sp.]|nr:hypothetical protein [Sphingomicrobium sp.]